MTAGGANTTSPEAVLARVPFFRTLRRVELARLVGALEEVTIPAGNRVFDEGDEGDALYLLDEGRVEISIAAGGSERTVATIDGPAYFGELGLLHERRTASATAASDVRLWRLPRDRFARAVDEQPQLALAVAESLADLVERRSRERVGAAELAAEISPPPVVPTRTDGPRTGQRVAGAAVALAVPLVLWWVPPPSDLGTAGWHVVAILLGGTVGWLLEPVPDFVVAIAIAAGWGLTDLAEPETVLSGFASSSWIVALGAVGIASATARSGLLFRTALLLLRIFPASRTGSVLALLLGGLVVTPLVPLGIARVATGAPLAAELRLVLGYAPRGRSSAALGFAALIGYGSFSGIFLTGLAMNFFVVHLLAPSDRDRFGWFGWLAAAAPAGAVLVAGSAALLLVFSRGEPAPSFRVESLEWQRRALGALTRQELAALVGVAVFLVAIVLQPVLDVDAAWPALLALGLTVALGALDRDSFRSSIDWPFVVLFGVLLGSSAVLERTGVVRWTGDELVRVTGGIDDAGVLLLIVAVVVVLGRLVLPWIPATLLFSLALVPAAPRVGLEPWVVGFVVLVAANTWLLPRQSELYRIAREGTKDELFSDRQGLAIGAAMTGIVLVAIAASVPYWRALGILTP